MRPPDPKPTDFQLFGLTGLVFGAAAALGILYALFKVFGWL